MATKSNASSKNAKFTLGAVLASPSTKSTVP